MKRRHGHGDRRATRPAGRADWPGLLTGLAGLLTALFAGACAAQPTGPVWVLGQSLPLSGPAFPVANRVLAGARAAVDQLNGSGGVAGRRIELVTLDDAGDPQRTAQNVRRLAREHGALAVLNCLGELACRATAAAAREAGLPLVGAWSGDEGLRPPAHPAVFALRPGVAPEARALRDQLNTLGVRRVAIVADGDEPVREAALAETLRAAGLSLAVEQADGGPAPTAEASLRAAFERAVAGRPEALLLVLGPHSLDRLARAQGWPSGLPPLLLTTASPWLTQVLRLFRDRAIGFTAVVPNPESSRLPIVHEFDAAIERLGSPEALSFEGLGAYLHLRLVAEALQRSGRGSLTATLQTLGRVSLGGHELRLAPGRPQGAEGVEIGIRSLDGRARR